MGSLDIQTAVQFNGNAMVYEDQAPLVGLTFHHEAQQLNDAQKLDIANEVAALVAFHLGWLAPEVKTPAVKPNLAQAKLEAMTQLAREYAVVREALAQHEQGHLIGKNKEETKEEIAKIVFDKIVFGNRYLRERYAEIKREQREARATLTTTTTSLTESKSVGANAEER